MEEYSVTFKRLVRTLYESGSNFKGTGADPHRLSDRRHVGYAEDQESTFDGSPEECGIEGAFG